MPRGSYKEFLPEQTRHLEVVLTTVRFGWTHVVTPGGQGDADIRREGQDRDSRTAGNTAQRNCSLGSRLVGARRLAWRLHGDGPSQLPREPSKPKGGEYKVVDPTAFTYCGNII